MKRIEFKLTMPGVASWNGQWSGAGRNYLIVRILKDDTVKGMGVPRSWSHFWNDGWAARITARIMKKGERRGKSAGFCGYDWMVTNIISHGSTKDPVTEEVTK